MQMTHKHDVYFSPYSTEAHNLVMQIADYCNKRGIWYKISESTLGIGIEYGGNVAYVIDADRKTEPTTQTETQNSNLTFEKRTMLDCYNCKKYETEGECIECHYEPKDECAKEYEYLGLKELNEMRQTERSE